MTTAIKISARIPPALAKEMDKLIEAGIYSNRSEIIKEALREFLLKKKYSKAGEEEYAKLSSQFSPKTGTVRPMHIGMTMEALNMSQIRLKPHGGLKH